MECFHFLTLLLKDMTEQYVPQLTTETSQQSGQGEGASTPLKMVPFPDKSEFTDNEHTHSVKAKSPPPAT